jgi:hypothetical protein
VESLIPEARVVSPLLPLLFSRNPDDPQYFCSSDDRIELGLDIFGSIFFMLSRYEEVVKRDRDIHGRFPSRASLAGQEGFLDRPIVNEYVEILWACLKRLWPSIERKRRDFRVLPSHDVDCPAYFTFYPKREIVMGMMGDVLKRGSPSLALKKLDTWRNLKAGLSRDPFDTFEWLMERSERSGWTSTFNFMAGGETQYDRPRYPLNHELVQDLLGRIADRGHEIGFHPSYATMSDETRWRIELDTLRGHIPRGTVRGGRQHYLRFETPTTWRFWNDSGLEYDSTLTYADRAGFRCGSCYEFPVYDLERRETLRLRERPTIVMESTVISGRYMGLGTGPKAHELMGALRDRCKMYGGDFAVLWHNSMLDEAGLKELYRRSIE